MIYTPVDEVSPAILDQIFMHRSAVVGNVEQFSKPETLDRALEIYYICEMLIAEGRLNKENLRGNVLCLDAGDWEAEDSPEIPSMLAFNPTVLTVSDAHVKIQTRSSEVIILNENAIGALKLQKSNSLNLITLFNMFIPNDDRFIELIEEIMPFLKNKGQLVVTGDLLIYKRLTTYKGHEAIANRLNHGDLSHLGLRATTGKKKNMPMCDSPFILRSILQENTLGLNFPLEMDIHELAHQDAIISTYTKV